MQLGLARQVTGTAHSAKAVPWALSIWRNPSQLLSVCVLRMEKMMKLFILTCPKSTVELFGEKANAIFDVKAHGK